MNFKKSVLNFLSYTILICLFIFTFLFIRGEASADNTLVLCVDSVNKQYIVIDSQYSCPNGFVITPNTFNLVGYTAVTSYDPTTGSTTGSSSGGSGVAGSGGGSGTVVAGTGLAVVPPVMISPSTMFNSGNLTGTYTDPSTGATYQNGIPTTDQNGQPLNGIYQNGILQNTMYPNTIPLATLAGQLISGTYQNGVLQNASLYQNGTLGANSINGQLSNSNGTVIPSNSQSGMQNSSNSGANNSSSIINLDPTLAHGPFENLDPTDYPYCVLLTHDMLYGSKDAVTGREVSALQSYLTDRGFLETGATGFYGRATELAVRKFEYRNEIDVNAVVTSEFRDIIKELTCTKHAVYVDKPISPSKISTTYSTKATVKKPVATVKTTTPKKVVQIPATTNTDTSSQYISITPTSNINTQIPQAPINNGPIVDNSKLSIAAGTVSISKRNNLSITYNTTSISPIICMDLNSTNCASFSNYNSLSEGVKGSLYEAINLSGQWVITLYGNSSWGGAGSMVNIYLKESPSSNVISRYSLSVTN